MDTHSISLPLPEPEALHRIVHQVLAGGDAVVAADVGARALLDEAAKELAGLRCRVLRVSAEAPGGLSLSGVMAQITARPDLDAHDDEVLERGFQVLTVLDAECDWIVLLVNDAQALQRTALRYLQFTCRAAPMLRLVLAGEQGLPDVMEEDEMAFLRTRLAASPLIRVARPPTAPMPVAAVAAAAKAVQPVPLPSSEPQPVPPGPVLSGPILAGSLLPGQSAGAGLPGTAQAAPLLPLAEAAKAVSLQAEPSARPAKLSRRRSPAVWIGLGMAASVAAGVLIGRQDWPAAVSQPAPEAALPTAPVRAAPAAAEPQRPQVQPQAATPRAAMPGRTANQGQAAVPAPATDAAAPPAPVPNVPAVAVFQRPDVQPQTVTPGQGTVAAPAPSLVPAPLPMQPPSSHTVYPRAAGEALEGPAMRPPAPATGAGQVPAQADAAPARPRPVVQARPVEARPREPAASTRFSRRPNEAPDASASDFRPSEPRERAAAGRWETPYAPPAAVPPAWQPSSAAPWSRTGEGSIVGTYTTDQNGVRTFRSTQ